MNIPKPDENEPTAEVRDADCGAVASAESTEVPLRDWFAAQILPQMIKEQNERDSIPTYYCNMSRDQESECRSSAYKESREGPVRRAYEYADKMLAERAKVKIKS